MIQAKFARIITDKHDPSKIKTLKDKCNSEILRLAAYGKSSCIIHVGLYSRKEVLETAEQLQKKGYFVDVYLKRKELMIGW
jgi:hypothetical protein